MDIENNSNPDQDSDKDSELNKPSLPRLPQYRYPKGHPSKKGGQIMPRGVAEEFIRTGQKVVVSTSTSAVSKEDVKKFNEELKKYMDSLAQKSFEKGFSSSFEKEPKKDSTPNQIEQMSKIFETISNKIVNKIGNVNTNVLALKKQNADQGTKLINLTTSLYSKINSQSDTVDELYKLMDIKLSQIVSNTSQNSGKSESKQSVEKKEPTSEPKVLGIIRGIAGLNKQLVEINKSILTRVVPLLSTISDKMSSEAVKTKVEQVTPKPDVVNYEERIVKKPAPDNVAQNGFGEGVVRKVNDIGGSSTIGSIGGIAAGAGVMALGGLMQSFKESMGDQSKLLEPITKKMGELPSQIFDSISSYLDKKLFGEKDGSKDDSSISNLEYKGEPIISKGENYDEFVAAIKQKSEESPKKTIIKKSKEFISEQISDISAWFSSPDPLSRPLEKKDNISEYDLAHSMKPPKDYENIQKKPVEKLAPPRGIHALDMYQKQPIGEYSIINNASNPLPKIESGIVSQQLSNSVQAIQQSRGEIETMKRENMAKMNQQAMQNVVINTNNNTVSKSAPPFVPTSPVNIDTTKNILDRMMLTGSYTGAGFLLN